MPGRKLTILAAVSLAALVVLLCGYFVVGVASFWRCTGNPGSRCARYLDIVIRDGSCAVNWATVDGAAAARPEARPFRVHMVLHRHAPELRYSLWRFAARVGGDEKTDYVLSVRLVFPIWCLMLPCMIAPLLWLRRRRRVRGFAVLNTVVEPIIATSAVVESQSPTGS